MHTTQRVATKLHDESTDQPQQAPTIDLRSARFQKKKVVHVLRHIRDDLRHRYPDMNLPDAWILRCLVESVGHDHCIYANWQKSIEHILRKIQEYSQNEFRAKRYFFELDGFSPLFPNSRNFNHKDAQKFALAGLRYLLKHFEN